MEVIQASEETHRWDATAVRCLHVCFAVIVCVMYAAVDENEKNV